MYLDEIPQCVVWGWEAEKCGQRGHRGRIDHSPPGSWMCTRAPAPWQDETPCTTPYWGFLTSLGVYRCCDGVMVSAAPGGHEVGVWVRTWEDMTSLLHSVCSVPPLLSWLSHHPLKSPVSALPGPLCLLAGFSHLPVIWIQNLCRISDESSLSQSSGLERKMVSVQKLSSVVHSVFGPRHKAHKLNPIQLRAPTFSQLGPRAHGGGEGFGPSRTSGAQRDEHQEQICFTPPRTLLSGS